VLLEAVDLSPAVAEKEAINASELTLSTTEFTSAFFIVFSFGFLLNKKLMHF
jgi:hypothetical protein